MIELAKQIPLLDACSIKMGQSPKSDSYNTAGRGLPFYQGNADFGKRNPTPRMWCSEPKKIAEMGDILISVRAPIGSINVATEKCCIGRGLAAITINADIVARDYLTHYLHYKRNELEHLGTGSTFKAIGKKTFASMVIPIGSIDEQISMSNKLDEIINTRETAISLENRLNELVKSRFSWEVAA